MDATRRRHVITTGVLVVVSGIVATLGHAATTAKPPAPPAVTFTAVPAATVPTGTPVRLSWATQRARTVTCSFDGTLDTACTSPMTFTELAAGPHSLTVFATGRGGRVSTRATWTVVAPPTVPSGSGPAGSTGEPSATTPATTPTAAPVTTPAPKVEAPVAPSAYTVPAGAVAVRSGAELTAALGSTTPSDIVLEDGTYDSPTAFTNVGGHRLYARNLGKAVLTAGLVMGGNYGDPTTLVRGVVFDVSAPAKAFGGGIVHIWGPGGANARILDCVFRGNRAIPYGILALNPSGLVLERSEFYGFTDVAARLSDNVQVTYGASTPVIDHVSDLTIDGVSRSSPGASNGTAEAGLWVGHPVAKGVSRIRVRNVSWSGIETVNNAWDTRFSDLDIDMSGSSQAAGVGVYLEHYTRNSVFENFTIRGARTGFNGEWADPATGGLPGAYGVTIRNGTIDSSGSALGGRQAGVYLDEGSYATTVTGVTFVNQNWAAIAAYRTAGTNAFTANTYRLGAAAVPLSTDHI